MANLVQVSKKMEKGTLKVVCGNVCKVEEGKGKAAGRLVTVSIVADGYDREAKKPIPVYCNADFWNADDIDDENGRKQAADRVRKMNLKPGQFIMMQVFESADGKHTYGNRIIKGSGVLTVNPVGENDNGYAVILGSAIFVKENGEKGVCNVNVVANDLVPEKGFQTVSEEIAFWNSEKEPNKASNMANLLTPKEKEDGTTSYVRGVFVTSLRKGDVRIFNRKDGEKGYAYDYTGFHFDFTTMKSKTGSKKKNSEQAPAPAPAPEPEPQEVPDAVDDFMPMDDIDALPWQ